MGDIKGDTRSLDSSSDRDLRCLCARRLLPDWRRQRQQRRELVSCGLGFMVKVAGDDKQQQLLRAISQTLNPPTQQNDVDEVHAMLVKHKSALTTAAEMVLGGVDVARPLGAKTRLIAAALSPFANFTMPSGDFAEIIESVGRVPDAVLK